MPINSTYDEGAIAQAVEQSLRQFYESLIARIDSLDIEAIMKRKNPYLFRAKAMCGASQIVEAVLSAFVSSSEETIFGNVFFEPIALAVSQGHKALGEGIDVQVERGDTIYAIAVKSGPHVFNASSRKKQAENFIAASKRAQQAKKRFVAIVGYGYGHKGAPRVDSPKLYVELAGREFWAELSGDADFHVKLLRLMGTMPEQLVAEFLAAYQRAANRLVREFTQRFCHADGSIDWEQLMDHSAGHAG